MPTYQLSRTVETVATGRASTTNTAKSDSAASVSEALLSAGADVAGVDTEAVEVYEFPSAPFEPYRVTVRATVSVRVEADGECDALDAGEERVEAVLAAADLDGWEYVGSTELEAPV